jgi:hypothetical protein
MIDDGWVKRGKHPKKSESEAVELLFHSIHFIALFSFPSLLL